MPQKKQMKIPTNKAEIVALIDATEKKLTDLVERRLPRLIPGISATIPSPTKPLSEKTPPTKEEE